MRGIQGVIGARLEEVVGYGSLERGSMLKTSKHKTYYAEDQGGDVCSSRMCDDGPRFGFGGLDAGDERYTAQDCASEQRPLSRTQLARRLRL